MERRGELAIPRSEALAAARDSRDWSDVGDKLGVGAGLAFMLATGIPADGSGVPDLPEIPGAPEMPSSPQRLVNARPHNPLTNDRVTAWVRARAAKELTP